MSQHRLRQQVMEAKEGPLELRRKKGKENAPGGRGRGKVQACSRENGPEERKGWAKLWVCARETAALCSSSFVLRGFVCFQRQGF